MASRTAIFVMVIVVVAAAAAEAAVTCGNGGDEYVTLPVISAGKRSFALSGLLCGRQYAQELARTTADRRAACQCLKNLATTVRPNIQKALSLASRCNVDLGGITVSPNINCNTIN